LEKIRLIYSNNMLPCHFNKWHNDISFLSMRYCLLEGGEVVLLIDRVQSEFDKMAAGMIEEAMEGLEQLTESPEMTDEIRFSMAESFAQLGFVEEALVILQELMVQYPEDAELRLFTAELYLESEQEEEALAILAEFPSEDKESFLRASLLAGELYLMQGWYETAEYKIREALKLYPQERILRTGLGEVYYAQEKYEAALTHFLNGIEISDYTKIGNCYVHIGQFEEALSYYKKALTVKPHDPDTLFRYGFVAFQMDEWQEALQKLEQVVNHDPFFTSVYPYLIEASIKLGQLDKALEWSDEGLKYDHTNPQLFYLKAQLLINTSQAQQQAEDLLDKALSLNEAHIPTLELKMMIYKDGEEWEAALECVNLLLDLAPERVDLFLEQGLLHEALDQIDQAEASYRKGLHLATDDIELFNHLAMLLRNKGELQEALVLWKRSLALEPNQWEIEELVGQYEDSY